MLQLKFKISHIQINCDKKNLFPKIQKKKKKKN